MFFYICSIAATILIAFGYKFLGGRYPFSRAITLLVLINIVVGLGLLENAVYNQDPTKNDGFGISNVIAYAVIGEGHWSQELFKQKFMFSIHFTIVLIIVLLVTMAIEGVTRSGKSQGKP